MEFKYLHLFMMMEKRCGEGESGDHGRLIHVISEDRRA